MTRVAIWDYDDLAARLSRHGEGQPFLIAVDGFAGAGKSTLAGRLAVSLGAELVEIDAFLIEHQGGYLDHLRYEELGVRLSFLVRGEKPLIVEGLCVKEVLSRIGLNAQAAVYVQRCRGGFWHDGVTFHQYDSAAEAIENEEQATRRLGEALGKRIHHPSGTKLVSQMERDLLEYHFSRRPHETSTFIYAWNDKQ